MKRMDVFHAWEKVEGRKFPFWRALQKVITEREKLRREKWPKIEIMCWQVAKSEWIVVW
jgi:hypothetical protein